MQIEQNVAIALKNAMEKRGESLMEFSEESGIPRSTLQGYLKGTSHPRADSLEMLAERLGISLADLVSGTDCFDSLGVSCLDPLLHEIQALHPDVKPFALNALSILRSAFQISDKLRSSDLPDSASHSPEDVYRYFLHEPHATFPSFPSYGILVKKRIQDEWTPFALLSPFSHDRNAVDLLARRCTSQQLSLDHLLDVVHDFLVQHAWDS